MPEGHDRPAPPEPAGEAIDVALLEPVLAQFPREPDQVIPALRAVQEVYGYIPAATVEAVAARLRISRARVMGVATFYTQFSLTPQGRHKVCVCRGTACHVRGGKQILNAVREELGVEPGETTADLGFTLETVACMGACALGPVMVVDGVYYGKLDPRKAKKVLGVYLREMSE